MYTILYGKTLIKSGTCKKNAGAPYFLSTCAIVQYDMFPLTGLVFMPMGPSLVCFQFLVSFFSHTCRH
jgi:hypothetical protein